MLYNTKGGLSRLVVHSDEVWSSLIVALVDWALVELENNAGCVRACLRIMKVIVSPNNDTK